MKSILISIKPKYVAGILNGRKTIEIRKKMPKCDLPIDVYIYCTKDNKGIVKEKHNGYTLIKRNKCIQSEMIGKVVAKFTLKKCEEWHNYSWFEITEKGCVSDDELRNYSKGKASLYIWHIDNLVIFDKPKELNEFYCRKYLKRPPQSWCYVEGLE